MTNNEVLDIIFRISNAIEYEVDEKNIVTILERQDHKVQVFLRKLNFKIPKYKKTKLDEYSSYVFLQINGKATVNEIGKKLEEMYGDKTNPLYERLLMFLNHININCHYIERT